MNIHPFLLQCAFRRWSYQKRLKIQNNSTADNTATNATNNNITNTSTNNNNNSGLKKSISSTDQDFITEEILKSVSSYADFVDAQCLSFLWPVEFNNNRVCFISGWLKW